ncbi:MAG: STAS/SEC14 domain-containing protein [Rhodocyclaceae bacterium]
MINIDHNNNLVAVAVFGEFSLSDYKEFEELVNYKVRFEGSVDLLFDLREMAGFTLDVAWEEIKFARQHAHDFGRIAVLTDDQWFTWSAWISQIFVDAEVQVFDNEEEARSWLNVSAEADPAE